MANKPTYKFKDNEDNVLTLMQSRPKTGDGKYGQWNLYEVTHEGKECVIFPSQILTEKLEQYVKGDTLNITKDTQGEFVEWAIELLVSKYGGGNPDGLKPKSYDPDESNAPDWDVINGTKSWSIHIQVAAKIAVECLPEKWKEKAKPDEMLDYWLHLITDHYTRATNLLKNCKNSSELQACWQKYEKVWASILTKDEFGFLTNTREAMEEQTEVPF